MQKLHFRDIIMILAPMKIYYTTYSNAHHDPNPLLFVMHSDSKYTEGLNIRYLSMARQSAFYNMIRILAEVREEESGEQFFYTGPMMYAIIKKYYPDFAKIAYRKYFTNFLFGKIVNDALNAVSPLMDLHLRTQALINESTSNLLERRAKNDMAVRVTNDYLYQTRVEEMRGYENLRYTVSKTPGFSKTPIENEEDGDEEDEAVTDR